MNDFIYALVTYGCHEDYDFMFIKINRNDQNKFREFCEQTCKIAWDYGFSISCWTDNITFERGYNAETIHEFQENYTKYKIKVITEILIDSSFGNHNLFKEREDLIELLMFEFLPVESDEKK